MIAVVFVALGVPVILAVLPVLVWIGTAARCRAAVRAVVARGSWNGRRNFVSVPVAVAVAVPVAGIGEGGRHADTGDQQTRHCDDLRGLQRPSSHTNPLASVDGAKPPDARTAHERGKAFPLCLTLGKAR